MTRGIIAQPYSLAMHDDYTRRQFYSHAQVLLADSDSAHKHWENESNNVQALMAEVLRLKTENAGLKTGYEAYEQVNAELKGENESLRYQIGVLQSDANSWQSGYDVGRHMGTKTVWAERRAVRKDAERYRWLRNACGVVEYKKIAGSIGPGMLPSGEKLEAAIDAAMGKGEQS